MKEQRSNAVPVAQVVHRARATHDNSISYTGTEWKDISGVIDQLKRGSLQDRWMDLCAYMLRLDGHLRTVHDTRINGVLRAELVIEPQSESEIDKAAADFVRESYESTPNKQEAIYHLLYAESVGFTGCENIYKRKRGMWHNEPIPIRPRDLRVDPDWYYEVRTYQSGVSTSGATTLAGYSEQWLPTKDRRDKWTIHAPTSGNDTVLTSGDLIACAPSFYFKKELEIGWLQGLERFANGILLASHPSGAMESTIAKIQTMLENVSFTHAATHEDTVNIQHLAGQMDSSAYDQAVTHFESVQSKILLGSTLNTDVAANGGNRALGQSQFATTTLPRLEVMANRLAETIARDWFVPLLKFNATAFGGIPGTPRIRFNIMGDTTPEITRDGIDAKTVTKNELRSAQGLPEWDEEEGGNEVAVIEPAPVAQAFSEQAQEVAAPRPLSRSIREGAATQLSLPMTRRDALGIGGRARKRRARLQIEGLGDLEHPPKKAR